MQWLLFDQRSLQWWVFLCVCYVEDSSCMLLVRQTTQNWVWKLCVLEFGDELRYVVLKVFLLTGKNEQLWVATDRQTYFISLIILGPYLAFSLLWSCSFPKCKTFALGQTGRASVLLYASTLAVCEYPVCISRVERQFRGKCGLYCQSK